MAGPLANEGQQPKHSKVAESQLHASLQLLDGMEVQASMKSKGRREVMPKGSESERGQKELVCRVEISRDMYNCSQPILPPGDSP